MDWLNRQADGTVRFFGIELGAVRIGDSDPAPTLTLRVEPNEWRAAVSRTAREQTGGERAERYRESWTRLIESLAQRDPKFASVKSPSRHNWLQLRHFTQGVGLNLVFARSHLRVEAYIDRGDSTTNEGILAALQAHRAELESAFADDLSWEPLPTRRASRLALKHAGSIDDVDDHDDHIKWFVENAVNFWNAINPKLQFAVAAQLPLAGPMPDPAAPG